ncbi:hypothetical protein [Vibrio sp. 10N.261.51.F12]|uniref:hypothetical protein n=1 Tax=Vibrio sp. 10N.261.51.F12 TaxID=3229679 RepID=UPI00354E185D
MSPYRPATSQGYMAAAVSVGFSIGTYIVGYLLDRQNIQGVMAFLAISGSTLMIAATLLIAAYRHNKAPDRSNNKALSYNARS